MLAQASVVPWIVMEIGSREAVASGVGFGVVSSAEYIPDERLTFARAADAEIYNHALLCCMAERTTARLIAAFLTAATEGRNRAKG